MHKLPSKELKAERRAFFAGQARKFWHRCVYYKWHKKCAKCGREYPIPHVHYLQFREPNRYTRTLVESGIVLCVMCRHTNQDAPYINNEAFMQWLNEAYPNIGKWLKEHKDYRRVINWKKEVNRLRSELAFYRSPMYQEDTLCT